MNFLGGSRPSVFVQGKIIEANISGEAIALGDFMGADIYKNLLDENLSWKEHIKYLENKTAKNMRFMDMTKLFLDKESLLALYYSVSTHI